MSFFNNFAAITGGPMPNWMQNLYGPPPAASITTAAPSAGGLYGGDINYTPSPSAYNAINPYSYMYDTETGASQLSADVMRAQYQDYLQRYAPIEDYAVRSLLGKNTQDYQFDLARAKESAFSAGANLEGQQNRAMGRYGLQSVAPSISQSNEVVGGAVGAMNQATFADEARRLEMLGGTSSASSTAARGV